MKMSKGCTKCLVDKPLTDFHKTRKTKSGRVARCKDCVAIASRKHHLNNKSVRNSRAAKRYQENKTEVLSRQKEYRTQNKDVVKATASKYYRNNKSEILAKQLDYYHSNKESILSKHREYYANNRVQKIEKNREWALSNRGVTRLYSANYRAKKLMASPPWLTETMKSEIDDKYCQARDCYLVTGEDYHVDHIVPLQGVNVCGLHVPWNLQVLPSDINLAKSNNYDDWSK